MGVRAVIQATIKSFTLATVWLISTGVISCVKMYTGKYTFMKRHYQPNDMSDRQYFSMKVLKE